MYTQRKRGRGIERQRQWERDLWGLSDCCYHLANAKLKLVSCPAFLIVTHPQNPKKKATRVVGHKRKRKKYEKKGRNI